MTNETAEEIIVTTAAASIKNTFVTPAQTPVQDYRFMDEQGPYKNQMDPFAYMQNIREGVLKALDEEVDQDSRRIQRLANVVQGQILGFTSDGTWNDIKSVNDEFVDFIFEGNEAKIKQLKTKIKRAVTTQLNKLHDIKAPDLFSYSFKREIDKVMEEERAKILPLIREIIKKQIHEEVVQPWEAMAKLQGLDITKGY